MDTNEKGKIYNRAYLQTKLDLARKSLLLTLDYGAKTNIGNATFAVEIRDNVSGILLAVY